MDFPDFEQDFEQDFRGDRDLYSTFAFPLEPPPVDNDHFLIQGQGQPLYANNFYQPVFQWPLVAEPPENIVAENPQAEPNRELEFANPQHHHHFPFPAIIPAIPNNTHGVGNRPGQEFRCGRKCRGVFAGLHKCSRHGRALTISCLEDDENCPSVFSKRSDFNRHCNTVHHGARAGAPARQLLDCPFPGCDRVGEMGFKRKDNLTQHRRNVHEEVIEKNPIRFGRRNGVA